MKKLLRWLLLLMPVCLFLSYYPVIKLGESESMYFELSVAEIWLVLFDLVGLVEMIRKRVLFRGCRKWWKWMLVPLWISLSVAWSLNRTRGILTAGLMWCVVMAIYTIWTFRDELDEKFREKWLKWMLGATLVVCGWCVVQCVLDLAGVPQSCSLLCDGCTYRMFGFPHPNGLAIEPQFMGNLLLAPVFASVWLWLSRKQTNKKPSRERSRGVILTTAKSDSALYSSTSSSSVAVVKMTTGSRFLCSGFLLVYFLIITTTLFLTFSRGAIYAFVVGMLFMSGYVVAKERKKTRGAMWKRVGMVWGLVVGAFVVSLVAQGVMAEVSPTAEGFSEGVSRVVNHLSLGVIDFRENKDKTEVEPVEKPVEKSEDKVVEKSGDKVVRNSEEGFSVDGAEMGGDGVKAGVDGAELVGDDTVIGSDGGEMVGDDGKTQSVFDGYVAESTDTRLRLTGAAIEVWRQSPQNVLVGVGLGGAGTALYNAGLSPAPREIVQNEYASLLLETGVVGVVLITVLGGFIIFWVMRAKDRCGLMLGLMVAYGVSLMFFSGLPNALHIYLLTAVLMWVV